jgi:hypothetical protein
VILFCQQAGHSHLQELPQPRPVPGVAVPPLVADVDGGDRTLVKWPEALPMNWVSDQAKPMNGTYGQWTGYFYVPKGTKAVGFTGGEHGEIRDAEDRPQFRLNGKQSYFYSVAVPEGRTARCGRHGTSAASFGCSRCRRCSPARRGELLLPKEIVEREQHERDVEAKIVRENAVKLFPAPKS